MFPEIKKRISSFLFSEEGLVSKQSLASTGLLVGVGMIASSLASKPAESTNANDCAACLACGGGDCTGRDCVGPCSTGGRGGRACSDCDCSDCTSATTHSNDIGLTVGIKSATGTHAHHSSHSNSDCTPADCDCREGR